MYRVPGGACSAYRYRPIKVTLRHVTGLVTAKLNSLDTGICTVSKTARLSAESHEKVRKLAEERDVPVSEVLDEIISGELDEAGIQLSEPVTGYCPSCGFEFRERHRESKLFGPDAVTCPVPSCPETTSSSVNRLCDELPAHVSEPIREEDLDQFEDDE